MSGGTFDYNQRFIEEIHEEIQNRLDRMGKEKIDDELYCDEEYYKKYPDEKINTVYPDEVIQIFKEGIKHLKLAEIYTKRIDWFLAGDDGGEELVKSLKKELEEIND